MANITIKQGDSYAAQVVLSGSNGLAYDLTGFSAKGAVRNEWGGSVQAQFTMSGEFNASGTFQASLSPDATMLLEAGNGVFDFKVVSGSRVITVAEGIAIVKPTATP